MFRAMGLNDKDLSQPLVGVANTWNELTPCNIHLDRLAKEVKVGVRAGGGTPLEFVAITVSDAIAMGHEGMKTSLITREVIADSVELVRGLLRFTLHARTAVRGRSSLWIRPGQGTTCFLSAGSAHFSALRFSRRKVIQY